MNESKELPDPNEKKKNITEAFNILIGMKKLRIPGSKKDLIDKMISDPKVLAIYEDPMACKGRKCLNCEGCGSFQMMISEVREEVDREEVIEDVPPMKAAEHAVERNMQDIAAMMQQVGQRQEIQFSSWEIIKFMREAILTTLKVDIFKIKKEIKKEPLYRTEISADDWTVIRTVMIINRIEWWLDDMAAQGNKKENPDIFNIFWVDKQNRTYLPLSMSFTDKDGKYLTIKEWVDSQPPKIRNKIMTIQNHFGSAIESQVKWTVNFRG